MTENNCDFNQEPGVGNTANVSQEIMEMNVPAEESNSEINDNHIVSQEASKNDSPDQLNNDFEELKNSSHEELKSDFQEEFQNNSLEVKSGSQDELNLALSRTNDTNSEVTRLECEDKYQDHWLTFSTFFRKVYHTILDGEKLPDDYVCHMDIVKELVANDPHQMFARLEMDLQEFIIEVKLRQMELLNCVHTDEGPHLFIFCLIESYNKLMFAASTLSPLLLQLEIEHLANFRITWRGLNQHLFHKLVFTEPKIQKVLPFCISKIGKMNSELSDFNKRLIRQFLTFDDEMTKIGGKWREAESAIIKYHQENSMLDAKERMMKVNWELIKTQTKAFHDELKSSGLCDNYFSESLKKIKNEIENSQDQPVCDCCQLSTTQCLINSVSYESFLEMEAPKSFSQFESSCKGADILAHLNADGKKMYSHLHKFKVQQLQQQHQQQPTTNGVKSPQTSPTANSIKDNMENTVLNGDNSGTGLPQQQRQNAQSLTSPIELHKTLIRKHQHQKKLMQMMQSSQQKDIQHKIQKQLQEHQLLLQQQRKIDELHAHLLQQHPMHMDKEMQKKVHLQMQHKLMQKHKQMEEKFHQQVQHHIQHHQDKQPPTSPKSSVTAKAAPNLANVSNCSHAKTATSKKNNHKCATSAPWLGNGQTAGNSAPIAATIKTTNSNSPSGNVTHKNSTTQTTAASATGQNRTRQQGLPDLVKSTSYICPKHSETNKNVLHNLADHLNSSDFSSDEDCCSERSNSPQRHCDCCYCEVFGLQSAPVSRNFQETRERLRLILTKKKAKSNSVATGNEKPAEVNVVAQTNIVNSSQPACVGVEKVKKEEVSEDKKVKPEAEYKGDKSIEEILDFIEGNKTRNAKRTAKQMRRRQRQLEEEERRRKEEEEAERLRQAELRRQEEEKRRIEEERRRQELLKEQNRKKNKKKNSKLNQQLNLLANEQNNKKNRKNQATSQQPPTNDKNRLAQIQSNKNTNQKQNVQQTKQLNQQLSQPHKKGKQEAMIQVKQGKHKGQEKQKAQQTSKNNTQKKPQQKGGKDDNSGQPQMVTIKRVMQPNCSEPTVTITLRGPTPKEDKVLYTLLNGQMCQVKEEKCKKQAQSSSNNVNNKKTVVKPSVNITSTYNGYNSPSPIPNMLPKSVPFNKSCSIIGNGVNSITERMERLKLGPHPAPNEPMQKMISAPTATQAELTTPTAIQINQAVNQLSSRPSFPHNFDLENIKLPPGITITKVDPATVNRKPIQMKQQAAPPPPPQTHVRQTMMPSMAGSSNVIVVDTGDKNNYYSEEQAVNGMKKKRRRRNKNQCENGQNMNNIQSPFGVPNGLPPRMGNMNSNMYGNPFMNNDYRNPPQQSAAIIQMNGSMVTIRNPALHQAMTGQQMDYHDGTKVPNHSDYRNSNLDENMFSPAPEELENGDVDEYERELEAFKRFCSQSVPAESKPKVNLNLEDIVLKKKGPVIGCS